MMKERLKDYWLNYYWFIDDNDYWLKENYEKQKTIFKPLSVKSIISFSSNYLKDV